MTHFALSDSVRINTVAIMQSPPGQATKTGKETPTYFWGLVVTSLLVVGLALCGYLLQPDCAEVPLTAIICLTGYVLGIPIGMAASPHKDEASHFKVMGGLVASFVSGLVASKLVQLDFKETFLSSSLQSGRSMLFLSLFVLGIVQTFIFRRYSDTTRPRDQYVPKPAEDDERA